MKVNTKLIAHGLENAVLIIGGIIFYDISKLIYKYLEKKYPNKKTIHKTSTTLLHIFVIFIIDILFIIILQKHFNIDIL